VSLVRAARSPVCSLPEVSDAGIDPDNTARRANARADGTVLKSIN